MANWVARLSALLNRTAADGGFDLEPPGPIREPQGYRESAYFSKVLQEDIICARAELKKVQENDPKKFRVAHGRGITVRFAVFHYYPALVAAYTGGYSIGTLERLFTELLVSAEYGNPIFLDMNDNCSKEAILDIRLNSAMTLSLISLGICLRIDAELMRRFIALTGPEGIIRVYDRLAQVFVPDRKLAPEDSGGIYRKLSDLIDLPKTAERKQLTQGKALRTYVNGWYNNSRGDGWHDSHKDTNDTRYRGYWCFEAAGVAAAFDLDDSLCRDSPYYPSDLVDFYRDKIHG